MTQLDTIQMAILRTSLLKMYHSDQLPNNEEIWYTDLAGDGIYMQWRGKEMIISMGRL